MSLRTIREYVTVETTCSRTQLQILSLQTYLVQCHKISSVNELTLCDAFSVVYKLISTDATAAETSDIIRTHLITRVCFTLVNI